MRECAAYHNPGEAEPADPLQKLRQKHQGNKRMRTRGVRTATPSTVVLDIRNAARCDVTHRIPSTAQAKHGEQGKAPVFATEIRVSADGLPATRDASDRQGPGLRTAAKLH